MSSTARRSRSGRGGGPPPPPAPRCPRPRGAAGSALRGISPRGAGRAGLPRRRAGRRPRGVARRARESAPPPAPAVRAMARGRGRDRRGSGRAGASRSAGSENAVEVLLHAGQLLLFLPEQRVRLLVAVHDVGRQEDRELGPLPAHTAGPEKEAEDRDVL